MPRKKRPPTQNEKHTAAAEHYFAAWPAERDFILARHERERTRLPGLLAVPDLDAVRALRKDADAITNATPERQLDLARAFQWLDVERGFFGGALGLALSESLPCPIAIDADFDELLAEAPEQLQARPPVAITLTPRQEHPYAALAITPSGYYIVDPQNFADAPAGENYRAILAELKNRDAASPTVRRLYHAFARDFWKWLRETQSLLSPNPIAELPGEKRYRFTEIDSLMTFSGKRDQALFRALMSADQWEHPAEDYPHIRDRELRNFKISIGGEPDNEGITPARVAELRPVFENIVDPKTVILYAACMDLWNRARQSGRNLTELQAVRIHVDDLCELFGYKKKPDGSFQYAHKQEISRRLKDLKMLEGHGYYVDEKNRQRRLSGAYAHVAFDDYVPLLGKPEPYEFIVRPGDAVYQMVEENPALMRVYKSLAPLTAKQRKFEKGGGFAQDYALKIGVYLCTLFRIRQATQSFEDPISMRTLVESSCIAPDATKAVSPNHYSRFRENIETACDLLRGKVIADWEYVPGAEERLPDRGSFKPWLQNQAIFRPLPDVIEAGKQRNAEQQRVIVTARRKKSKQASRV